MITLVVCDLDYNIIENTKFGAKGIKHLLLKTESKNEKLYVKVQSSCILNMNIAMDRLQKMIKMLLIEGIKMKKNILLIDLLC